jgi:hypothetical protein
MSLASYILPEDMILSNFRFDQVFSSKQKNSASMSVIVKATYTGPLTPEYERSVVFKCSFGYTEEQQQTVIGSIVSPTDLMEFEKLKSLNYEECVYRNVSSLPDTTHTILHVHTFHYKRTNLAYLTGMKFNLSSDIKQQYLSEIQNLTSFFKKTYQLAPSNVQLLVTETKQGTVTLSRFLRNAVPSKILKELILQSLATIHMMSNNNLRHNDLHSGNLLVAPAEHIRKRYTIGAHSFEMDMTFKVLFFDWDLSYAPSFCGRNPSLDGRICEDAGMCNEEGSAKYDTVLFLYNISLSVDNAELRTFFNNVIDSKLTEADFSKVCSATKCGRLKSKKGMSDNFPDAVPSIEEIVSHSYFDELRA